jgi:hypothetical protein
MSALRTFSFIIGIRCANRSTNRAQERRLWTSKSKKGRRARTVLDTAGKLTIDQGAQRLKDKVNSLIAQGRITTLRLGTPC